MIKSDKITNYNRTFVRQMNGRHREFPCDLCGGSNAVEVPHVRKYTRGQVIHICQKCGLVYVKTRRPYDKIAEVWSTELFGKAYTSKTPLMLARHTYVAELIDQHLSVKNKRVCDVGAGEGQFLNIVRENYRARVFGIEPSPENCRIMKNLRVENFEGTIEDYVANSHYKECQPDILTMMWTLENATSCRNMLIAAHKMLKTNGYLVVATGSRILVPFSKPLNLYLSSNPVDTHPVRFSINTLTSILAITGFRIAHTNHYLNDGILCIIARKCKISKKITVRGDDFQKVYDFFERWHKETLLYQNQAKSNTDNFTAGLTK